MNKYEFNATNLIAETFEERGVKFDVVSHHGSEQLLAGFSVDCGPNVIMRSSAAIMTTTLRQASSV